MGWPFGPALSAEMQRAYGWVGSLLWAHGFPPAGPVSWTLWHISLLIGAAIAVPLLIVEAGSGRAGVALQRLLLGVSGVVASRILVAWLWQLNSAALATIALGVAKHAMPPPAMYQTLVQLLVFGIPYLLLLLGLALLLIVRLAAIALFVAIAPLPWLLSTHHAFRRLPLLWLYELAAWTLLPAAEGFVLVAVRGLAGELPLAVPASDMLLGLVLLAVMVRLPFTLLRGGQRWLER
ncbi:MAG: hypothetical protein M0Z66_05665 [Thermaerobacter sp.]|nr:hypothetical protein [Thermaerobacter sp.]